MRCSTASRGTPAFSIRPYLATGEDCILAPLLILFVSAVEVCGDGGERGFGVVHVCGANQVGWLGQKTAKKVPKPKLNFLKA